jgi:CopG-like RHH_1 or ribbon-helix-helix domain, RHH_5
MTQRQRVNVTLPEDVHRILSEWAESEDRTLANLLAHLASKAARDRQDQAAAPPSKAPPNAVREARSFGLAAESAGEWKVDNSGQTPD